MQFLHLVDLQLLVDVDIKSNFHRSATFIVVLDISERIDEEKAGVASNIISNTLIK